MWSIDYLFEREIYESQVEIYRRIYVINPMKIVFFFFFEVNEDCFLQCESNVDCDTEESEFVCFKLLTFN